MVPASREREQAQRPEGAHRPVEVSAQEEEHDQVQEDPVVRPSRSSPGPLAVPRSRSGSR